MRISVYNEDLYFKGEEEVLAVFYRILKKRQNRWQEELELFPDTIEKYNQVVAKLAEVIRCLGFKSSLECSIALSQIIDHGYASVDMNFRDDAPNPEFEVTSKYGMSIIRGVGCCRNFVAMHQEVMELLGYPVKKFYCYERDSIFKNGLNEKANHVISLIEFNNGLYGIDLYNGSRLYKFKNGLNLTEISTRANHVLRYKPYYEITMGESSLDDIILSVREYEEIARRGCIDPFRYEDEIKYGVKRKIYNSHDELFGFHQDTYALKKDIVRDMADRMFIHK